LYDIWPGNGAGLFLQPRSLHRAYKTRNALSRVHTSAEASETLSLAGMTRPSPNYNHNLTLTLL